MRGGKRTGAGRKCEAGQKRVTFTVRVLPETKQRIDEMRKRGVRVGPLIDKWVKAHETAHFLRNFEKEFGGTK